MKLYREYAGSSISMADDPDLRGLLHQLIQDEQIQYVLESGTYTGVGSTTFVAECFPPSSPPKEFITLEASWKFWRKARRNLERFPFVTCLWGLSLELQEALAFVSGDEFIRNHASYDHIFIDNLEDPVEFYRRELLGKLGPRRFMDRGALIGAAIDRPRHFQGEGLLRRWLEEFRDDNPLIILDSAGGTGLLEFRTVLETLKDRRFVILLDDIHHVKHYRSLQHIKSDTRFEICRLSQKNGWVLARHLAAQKAGVGTGA